MFGSVGTKDIAEAINAKAGSDITKSEVLLPNGAIRELGSFEIVLNLGYEVTAAITVSVEGLGSAAVTDDGSLIEEIDEAEAAAEKAEAEAEAEIEAEGEAAAEDSAGED